MDRNKKIAQQRSLLHKGIEKFNPISNIPYIFSPSLREVRDSLIEYDDMVREDAKDIKKHLNLAETSFNRKEYVAAVLHVRNFYHICKTVTYRFSQLTKSVNKIKDEVKNEMLYGDHDEHSIKRLVYCSRCNGSGKRKSGDKCQSCKGSGRQIRNTKRKLASMNSEEIIKESGISDIWHNVTNDKARSVWFWEVAFPNASKKIKSNISALIEESKNFQEFLLQSMDSLSYARANRKIEDYLNIVKNIQTKFWGQYNVKYFKYIKLAFDDDVEFLYSYMGTPNEAQAVKETVESDKSVGEGEDPGKSSKPSMPLNEGSSNGDSQGNITSKDQGKNGPPDQSVVERNDSSNDQTDLIGNGPDSKAQSDQRLLDVGVGVDSSENESTNVIPIDKVKSAPETYQDDSNKDQEKLNKLLSAKDEYDDKIKNLYKTFWPNHTFKEPFEVSDIGGNDFFPKYTKMHIKLEKDDKDKLKELESLLVMIREEREFKKRINEQIESIQSKNNPIEQNLEAAAMRRWILNKISKKLTSY